MLAAAVRCRLAVCLFSRRQAARQPPEVCTRRQLAPRRFRPTCCAESSSQSGAVGVTTAAAPSPPAPPPSPAAAAPPPTTSAGAAAPPASAVAAADIPDAGLMDIRVGRVVSVQKHPEADSLYVEEVDVGEEGGPRTICSGLVKFVPLEALEDRLVVVLTNLKPRNMRGVKSNGMLLCASDAAHENVELLTPPEGSAPGDRVWFGEEGEGEKQPAPATPNQVQKKKLWEAVQPLLKTSEALEAGFVGRPMRTSAGVVTCANLRGANIS